MKALNNPTGRTTGIGKGEAQVFGDTYNPLFKEKLKDAKKENKEITEAMAKASDMSQLWSRDVQSFKPMVNNYQDFVKKNAKALIKGDFDATLKNKQMMNELTQYTSSSKESQKFFNETLKNMLNNPGKFYKKDIDRLRKFGESSHSGDFDYSKYGVNSKIDVPNINKGLREAVSKMGLDLEVLRVDNVNGEKVLIDGSNNKSVDLNPLIELAYKSAVAEGGQEQADEFLNQEWRNNLIENLPNFLKEERTTKLPNNFKPVSNTAGGQNAIALANRRKELIYNVIHDYNATEELSNLVNKFNPNFSENDSKVTTARVINPPEKGVQNRTVYFQTEDGEEHYYDVTDEGFFESFNSLVSNFGNQQNLDDNDLSKAPDYAPASGREGTNPKRTGNVLVSDMFTLLSGADKIEDIDRSSIKDLRQIIKSETLKSELESDKYKNLGSSDEEEKEAAFSLLLTDLYKGKTFESKKIKEIKADSPYGDSDYIDIVYVDGTKDNIKLDDDEALKKFLGSMYSIKKKEVTSKEKETNKKSKPLPTKEELNLD
tara:strand:- start:12784 stop:14415 length:1632 start_codon:yes stop_codon:yes gene_type:complete